MPKTGMSDSEWRERILSFVEGKFEFGRGQRPPKGSSRAKQLQGVESCPKHCNKQLLDVLGRKIQCKCGFHQNVRQSSPLADTILVFFSESFFKVYCSAKATAVSNKLEAIAT